MHYLSTSANNQAWLAAVAELEARAPTSRAAALQLAEIRRNPSATFCVYQDGHEVELSRPQGWNAHQKILAEIRRLPVAQASAGKCRVLGTAKVPGICLGAHTSVGSCGQCGGKPPKDAA